MIAAGTWLHSEGYGNGTIIQLALTSEGGWVGGDRDRERERGTERVIEREERQRQTRKRGDRESRETERVICIGRNERESK